MATLIQSKELDVAAVFPQCTDNQFVSFEEFRDIAAGRLSYKDGAIAARRNSRTAMEINRALVYGQQVCVNRASLPNCKPLYEFYLPSFMVDGHAVQNPRYQIDEFGQLLQTRAIVPYLFQGTTIEGDGTFNLDDEGQRALAHLLEKHIRDISFLTLGPTPNDVRQNAAKIALEFETRTDRLAGVAEDPSLYPLLLADVLPCAELIESVDGADRLRATIFSISDLVSNRKSRRRGNPNQSVGMLTREDVYKEVLVKTCSCGQELQSKSCKCVTEGRFAFESGGTQVGAMFCVKTLIDLVYAANIPDMLHKYLMTPWQLPTRNALQDNGPIELAQVATIDDVARATFDTSQRFHASASEAMYLPMLDQLTLADICAIREMPQWSGFMQTQERLLLNPLENAHHFDEFQAAFSTLQLAISRYWSAKAFDGSRGRRYQSFVSGVFQIGKYALKFGVRTKISGPEVVWLDMIIDYVANCAERVSVGPAKLLFEVFDVETRTVDAARSWSVDWMRKQVAWDREELLSLLKEERKRAADMIVDSGEVPADVSGG